MPSEGLRLGRDSGSIICDTLKKWRFRTGWGGKIGYLNYGARNSLTNYTQYLIGRYENNKLVRLLKFSINIVLRVVRKIMRIL